MQSKNMFQTTRFPRLGSSQAKFLASFFALAFGIVNSGAAWAQRPTAPKLFPQKTLLYARIDDNYGDADEDDDNEDDDDDEDDG